MPTPEKYITAEELRIKEDNYLRGVLGLTPQQVRSMTEAERASKPRIQELRAYYGIKPTAETDEGVQAADYKETKAEAKRMIGDDLYDLTRVEPPVADDPAGNYASTISYDPVSFRTTATPIETTTSYRPAGAGDNSFWDAFGRQVSIPYDSSSYVPAKPDVEDQIAAATMEAGKQQQFWDDVARVAADELRAKLTEQDPSFVELPLEEQRKIIFSVINGINYAPTIKTDTSGYEPTVDWNPVPRNVEQGDIPDYTPEQSVYLKAYRAEATKRKATALEASGMTTEAARAAAIDYVNNAIGKPQWWEDPNLKAQRLAADPDFNTVMGFGTIEYPSGATVESTPSYALRIFMSPANMVTGMIGGALGAMDADIQAVRESSDITPVMVQNDPTLTTWEKSVRAGLDNVKRNRGATEEIYDLGIYTGVDQYIGKPALFAGALLTDIIAVPVIPGAGFVEAAIKGGVEATKVAKAAGQAMKATDVIREAAKGVAKGAVEAEPSLNMIYWAGKKVGFVDAPNDIRLIAADRLATVAKGAVEAAPEAAGRLYGVLPKALSETVQDLGKLTKDLSVRGLEAILDTGKYTSKDVARWAQMAIKSNDALADLVQGSDSVAAIVKVLAGDATGLKALRAAALEEAAVKYIVGATKDMGPGSLYLLTAKTAVPNSKIANAILDTAKKSKVGKAIAETIKEGKVTDAGSELAMKTGAVTDEATGVTETIGGETAGTVGRDATSWIEISDSNKAVLAGYLTRRLSFVDDAQKSVIRNIIDNISYDNNKLTIRQLNQIQEMLIDDIARAKYTTKSLSEGAIEKMAPDMIEQLTKSQPLRDGAIFTLMRQKAQRFMSTKPTVVPAMQKAINDIQQSVSAMPDAVIFRMKELRKNIEMAKQYGLAKLPASNKEALFTMVFKPKGALSSEAGDYAAELHYHVEAVVNSIDGLIRNPKSMTVSSNFFGPIKIESTEAEEFNKLSQAVRNDLKNASDDLIKEITNIASTSSPERLLLIQNSLSAYLDNVSTILKGTGLSVISKEKVMDLIQAVYFDLESKAIVKTHVAQALFTNAVTDDIVDNLQASVNAVYELLHHSKLTDVINANLRRMIIARSITIMDEAATGLYRNPFESLRQINLGEDASASVLYAFNRDVTILQRAVKQGDPDAWKILEAIDDAAQTVLENNKLLRVDITKAIDELQEILEGTAKGSFYTAGQGLKTKTVELASSYQRTFNENLIRSIGDTTLSTDKLKAALRSPANANNPRWQDYVLNALNLKKLQYFFMLTIRSRFHGMNFLTAPFIMGSTIGGKATLGAMPSLLKGEGTYVAARALFPLTEDVSLISKDMQIAFTTTTGKVYTWREVIDIIQRSGIVRTDAGLENVQQALKNVAAQMELSSKASAKGAYKAAQIGYDTINSIAPLSDLSFRASVLLASLKAGESELTAVNKAREALFDYGKMSQWEQKYLANYLAFYSFLRASVGNVLWNILNNPSRIANQIKATKRGPMLLTEDEYNNSSLFYEPDYAQYRPLYSVTRGADKQSYGTYLPVLPLIDSYVLLAKVISIPVNFISGQPVEMSLGEFAMERSNPTLQAVFSKRLEETYSSGRIDPRHISMLKATGQWDTFKKIIGEPVEVPAKPGEAVWLVDANGVKKTYRFEDQNSINRYIALLKIVSLIGGDTVIKDYAPLIGADAIENSIELTTSIPELLGLTTDMKLQEPNEVATRKIEQRAAELNKKKADR